MATTMRITRHPRRHDPMFVGLYLGMAQAMALGGLAFLIGSTMVAASPFVALLFAAKAVAGWVAWWIEFRCAFKPSTVIASIRAADLVCVPAH